MNSGKSKLSIKNDIGFIKYEISNSLRIFHSFLFQKTGHNSSR